MVFQIVEDNKHINIMETKPMKNRNSESGNVLFLILIAVALFAALSYAVTSSSRSGGGDANKETNLISSATITQYPASIRTAILRMQVSGGVATADLEFNAPSDFGNCSTIGGVQGAYCVFHPSGGGATYTQAPADVMANGNLGTWTFNGDFEIVNIGITTSGDAAGNEIIAFLPGISEGVCTRINDELGIASTPVVASSIAGADPTTEGYLRIMDDVVDYATTNDITLGTGGVATTDALDGHAYGCFRNTASGDFVYFHVMAEQ